MKKPLRQLSPHRSAKSCELCDYCEQIVSWIVHPVGRRGQYQKKGNFSWGRTRFEHWMVNKGIIEEYLREVLA